MGRVFEALRQTPGPAGPPTPPPELAGPTEAEEEPIPFIEVGPRRSVEGSPCVLATPAPPSRPGMGFVAPTAPAGAGPQAVTFRPPPAPWAARSRLAPELVAYHAPEQAVSAQYRDLLAGLVKALPDASHHALLFIPVGPEASGATVLLNLAVTAARQGRRVVAVDANLRQPALAGLLGLPPAPGLREVLGGSAPLDQAVRETEQARLLALPAGLAETGPGMRFVAETMRSLLRQLRQRHDLVLVSGPRWDGRPEVSLLAAACDAVYLVVPEQDAETPEVDELLQAIPRQGARLGGCILAG